MKFKIVSLYKFSFILILLARLHKYENNAITKHFSYFIKPVLTIFFFFTTFSYLFNVLQCLSVRANLR